MRVWYVGPGATRGVTFQKGVGNATHYVSWMLILWKDGEILQVSSKILQDNAAELCCAESME